MMTVNDDSHHGRDTADEWKQVEKPSKRNKKDNIVVVGLQ
jgi:hypothetical protein